MPTDWFRTPDWDAVARDDFERRLARARPYNRPQYLKIKAIALREDGQTDASRAMLHRALDDPNIYNFEAACVTELLGDLSRKAGNRDEAEARYRHVLTTSPTLNGTSGSLEISLAEVLAEKQDRDATEEALRLLEAWLARPQLQFDSQLFRWHVALIRLSQQIGDEETVQRAATTALTLASRGPQLPRHKTVGLVTTDQATLDWLRDLAEGPTKTRRWPRFQRRQEPTGR